jgi:hypothetical protein
MLPAFGLVIAEPHDLRDHGLGLQAVRGRCVRLVPAELTIESLDLYLGARIDAVENARPQWPAHAVHRDHRRSERTHSDRCHLTRVDVVLTEEPSNEPGDVSPPDRVGIVLRPPRKRPAHVVVDDEVRHHATLGSDQRTLTRLGSDVYAQEVGRHRLSILASITPRSLPDHSS